MCIRDSASATQLPEGSVTLRPDAVATEQAATATPAATQLTLFVYYDSKTNTYHTTADCPGGSGAAVSYTPLDVYKRQMFF